MVQNSQHYTEKPHLKERKTETDRDTHKENIMQCIAFLTDNVSWRGFYKTKQKYFNKKQSRGEMVCFISQFQVTVHHYHSKEVKAGN